jgi:hypothetical protein
MKKRENKIDFNLVKIKVDEFATNEEAEASEGTVKLALDLKSELIENEKLLILIPKFLFKKNDIPFITLQSSFYFVISDDSWKEIIYKNDKNLSFKFPRSFVKDLLKLSIDSMRGILHAKTENGIFNKYILPLKDYEKAIENDFVF